MPWRNEVDSSGMTDPASNLVNSRAVKNKQQHMQRLARSSNPRRCINLAGPNYRPAMTAITHRSPPRLDEKISPHLRELSLTSTSTEYSSTVSPGATLVPRGSTTQYTLSGRGRDFISQRIRAFLSFREADELVQEIRGVSMRNERRGAAHINDIPSTFTRKNAFAR